MAVLVGGTKTFNILYNNEVDFYEQDLTGRNKCICMAFKEVSHLLGNSKCYVDSFNGLLEKDFHIIGDTLFRDDIYNMMCKASSIFGIPINECKYKAKKVNTKRKEPIYIRMNMDNKYFELYTTFKENDCLYGLMYEIKFIIVP